MNTGKSWMTLLPLLLGSVAGCEFHAGQDGNIMHYSIGNGASQSVAAISGQNSVVVINGDTLRISAGNVSLNGVSYGQVDEDDRVEYRVRNGRKSLTVNGVARGPAGHAG
ncbi:MAG: hypothetical protein ACO1NO_11150 [Burkholderiaceae bacterium]